MNSESTTKVYERGLALAEEKKYDQAIACIEQYLRSVPSDFNAWNDMGVIKFCLRKDDEAIAHFEKARSLCDQSESAELNWNLCEAYLSSGQPACALGLFDEMARQETLNADILNRTANMFLAEGSSGNAVEVLLRSLAMSPSQEILKPMIDIIKSKRPAIAVFTNDQTDYGRNLTSFLQKRFTVRYHHPSPLADIRRSVNECDIAVFAGCGGMLSDISYLTGPCRKLAVLSEDDIYSRHLSSIRWDGFDSVVLMGRPSLKETFIEKYGDIENHTTIISVGHSVDTERFRFTDRPRGRRIACLDSLSLKNNPMFILQCMQKLNYIDKDYRLYFAGAFDDERTENCLQYMIDELGLSNVVFFDRVENPARWLHDKHYIISAGTTDNGIPNILKGMSCGLKPLVHNFPGAREIINPEFTFNLAEDFCRQILSEQYQPLRYRMIVEQQFGLASQTKAINNVLVRLEKQIDRRPADTAEPLAAEYGGSGAAIRTDNMKYVQIPAPESNLSSFANDFTYNLPDNDNSFDNRSSRVIPVKPIETDTLEVYTGPYQTQPAVPAPHDSIQPPYVEQPNLSNTEPTRRNTTSINQMSADVLKDWRAFADRIKQQGQQPQPTDNHDAHISAESSAARITPLNMPDAPGKSRIMEIPTARKSEAVFQRVEDRHAPFM
jgi:glycosyltransferase involved in cell wall biosynthesis